MKSEEIRIQYQKYSIDELPTDLKELREYARLAVGRAYAPYSRFKVGAAVRLANGEIITGNNQENVAYPAGLCAERVALFYANARYPDVPVSDLFVIAESGNTGITEKPVTPCGSCRQVLQETEMRYKKEIRVTLCGKTEAWVFKNGSQLLL